MIRAIVISLAASSVIGSKSKVGAKNDGKNNPQPAEAGEEEPVNPFQVGDLVRKNFFGASASKRVYWEVTKLHGATNFDLVKWDNIKSVPQKEDPTQMAKRLEEEKANAPKNVPVKGYVRKRSAIERFTYSIGTPVIYELIGDTMTVGIVTKYEDNLYEVKGKTQDTVLKDDIVMAYFPRTTSVKLYDYHNKQIHRGTIKGVDLVRKQYLIESKTIGVWNDNKFVLRRTWAAHNTVEPKDTLDWKNLNESFPVDNMAAIKEQAAQNLTNETWLQNFKNERNEEKQSHVTSELRWELDNLKRKQLLREEEEQRSVNAEQRRREQEREEQRKSWARRMERFNSSSSEEPSMIDSVINVLTDNPVSAAIGAAGVVGLGAAASLISSGKEQNEETDTSAQSAGYSTAAKVGGVLGTVGALAGLYKFYKNRKSAGAQSEESSEGAATGRISRNISKRAKFSATGKTWTSLIIGAFFLIVALVWCCMRKKDCQDEAEDLEMGLQELENQP